MNLLFSASMLCVSTYVSGCLVALCAFILWTKNLVKVYMHILSVMIIFSTYWVNVNYVESVLELPALLETAQVDSIPVSK